MTKPEKNREITESFGFPENTSNIDRDKALKVAAAINALTVEFPDGGWLSTLVWNTRNNYFAFPDTKFDASQVQMIVEGFLTEIEILKGRADLDSSQPTIE